MLLIKIAFQAVSIDWNLCCLTLSGFPDYKNLRKNCFSGVLLSNFPLKCGCKSTHLFHWCNFFL